MTTVTVTAVTLYCDADSEPADVHVFPGTPQDADAQIIETLRDRDDRDDFAHVPAADLIEAMQDGGWSITIQEHTVTVPPEPEPEVIAADVPCIKINTRQVLEGGRTVLLADLDRYLVEQLAERDLTTVAGLTYDDLDELLTERAESHPQFYEWVEKYDEVTEGGRTYEPGTSSDAKYASDPNPW